MISDVQFYDYFRGELKKISRRLGMGLEDNMDLTIAVGIINSFLESQKPDVIEEAKKFITKYPVVNKLLKTEFNF